MVGISAYTFLPKLNNARNDAQAIVKALVKLHNIKPEHIVSCFDCHSFELFAAFKKFVAGCRPGDFAIIFFSGHGCAFQNHQCLLARGLTRHEKIILNNGRVQRILDSALTVDVMIGELRAQGVNKHLLLLDCCHEFRVQDIPRAIDERWKEKDKNELNIPIGDGNVIGYATSRGDYAADGGSSDKYQGKTGHGTNQPSISSFARVPLSPA